MELLAEYFTYEDLMQLKNVLIYFSGLMTGIILITILFSLVLLKSKTRRISDKVDDVAIIKVKDKKSNDHLVFNVKNFTQAFYSTCLTMWFAISPKKHYIIIRDAKKERRFFNTVIAVYVLMLILTVWGIVDVVRYAELVEKINIQPK